MRGLRPAVVGVVVGLVALVGVGSAWANGGPPPVHPADPVLRPLPVGEPTGVTTTSPGVWHSSLSCAGDTQQSNLSWTVGATFNVACYGPPGVFPNGGSAAPAGTDLGGGSVGNRGRCNTYVYQVPFPRSSYFPYDGYSDFGMAFACNLAPGTSNLNLWCAVGTGTSGSSSFGVAGCASHGIGAVAPHTCTSGGYRAPLCDPGGVGVPDEYTYDLSHQRLSGVHYFGFFTSNYWIPTAPTTANMPGYSGDTCPCSGVVDALNDSVTLFTSGAMTVPPFPSNFFTGGSAGAPPGLGAPVRADVALWGTDGVQHVIRWTDVAGVGAWQGMHDSYGAQCSWSVVSDGFTFFGCALTSPLAGAAPFTFDPSRGLAAVTYSFANGLVVGGSQTEAGEPHGWPMYVDPGLATSALTPVPFSRFGPAVADQPKLGCDVAGWSSVPSLSGYPAVTAGESVVWTVTFFSAGKRTLSLFDFTPAKVEVSSTEPGLVVVLPPFVYPSAMAAGQINPQILCTNGDGSQWPWVLNGSGPCLGGTPVAPGVVCAPGTAGAGGPRSVGECMSGTGFGVSPSTWLPALGTLLGCVAQVLFVPSDWGAVTRLWAQIKVKAPFSFVYDVMAFLPTSVTALSAAIGSGSCVAGTPTLAQLQADPAAAARAPCSLQSQGGSGLAALRTATLAIVTLMLSLAVLKTSMRVLG